MQDNTLYLIKSFTQNLNKLATKQVAFPETAKLAKKLIRKTKKRKQNLKTLKVMCHDIEDSIEKEIRDNPNNIITIYCPITNEKLYTLEGNNTVYLTEHGLCRACGQSFHITALAIENIEKSDFPIRYQDCLCKKCNKRTI